MKQSRTMSIPVLPGSDAEQAGNADSDDLQLKSIQRELWRRLHDRFKRSFEQRLFAHIDQMIEDYYPGYCSNDGKVVDRRLAQRIGIDPAIISRLRAGDGNAMTRMSQFLALMNLCGVNWCECAFMPPQQAVLDAVTHIFPLAQEYVGTSEADSPNDEQVLVLYFASRQGLLAVDGNLEREQCEKVIELVAAAECDAQDEPVPLIPQPRIRTCTEVHAVIEVHEKAWRLLLDTFPFLGKPTRDGHSWGIF